MFPPAVLRNNALALSASQFLYLVDFLGVLFSSTPVAQEECRRPEKISTTRTALATAGLPRPRHWQGFSN